MNRRRTASHARSHLKRLSALIPCLVTLLLAVCSGVFLFSNAIRSELTSAIVSSGLDPLRAQLIAALMLTSGAAVPLLVSPCAGMLDGDAKARAWATAFKRSSVKFSDLPR